MSRMSTNRAAYQNLSHISLGHRKPQPLRAATPTETSQVRSIMNELGAAIGAQTDSTFEYRLSNAYRQLFKLMKERTAK